MSRYYDRGADAREQAFTELSGGVNPFRRGTWYGKLRAVDGAAADDFAWEDVAEVLAHAATGDDDPDPDNRHWDGNAVGLIRLKDGRFVTWETTWGPTGDGFSEDAYGGNADVLFASTLEAALRFGLTDAGRRMLLEYQPDVLAEAIARFMSRADATLALQGLFPSSWLERGGDFPVWRDE